MIINLVAEEGHMDWLKSELEKGQVEYGNFGKNGDLVRLKVEENISFAIMIRPDGDKNHFIIALNLQRNGESQLIEFGAYAPTWKADEESMRAVLVALSACGRLYITRERETIEFNFSADVNLTGSKYNGLFIQQLWRADLYSYVKLAKLEFYFVTQVGQKPLKKSLSKEIKQKVTIEQVREENQGV